MEDPELALDLMARQELGLDPDELGSPVGAAISSLASFAVGALIPLLPFVLLARRVGAGGGGGVSGARALFVVGALAARLSGRPALFGGRRMLLIGAAAAAVTYGIGKAVRRRDGRLTPDPRARPARSEAGRC